MVEYSYKLILAHKVLKLVAVTPVKCTLQNIVYKLYNCRDIRTGSFKYYSLFQLRFEIYLTILCLYTFFFLFHE